MQLHSKQMRTETFLRMVPVSLAVLVERKGILIVVPLLTALSESRCKDVKVPMLKGLHFCLVIEGFSCFCFS